MASGPWLSKVQTPFRQQQGSRRRYLCAHGRRKAACRECGGLLVAAGYMHRAARFRAKKAGVPCSITAADILALCGDGKCPVFGVPYEFSLGKQGGGDLSPSLDRFVPELGYTKENCFVISGLANRIKQNASARQVQQVADWMKAHGRS